jgi:hypothetical protein
MPQDSRDVCTADSVRLTNVAFDELAAGGPAQPTIDGPRSNDSHTDFRVNDGSYHTMHQLQRRSPLPLLVRSRVKWQTLATVVIRMTGTKTLPQWSSVQRVRTFVPGIPRGTMADGFGTCGLRAIEGRGGRAWIGTSRVGWWTADFEDGVKVEQRFIQSFFGGGGAATTGICGDCRMCGPGKGVRCPRVASLSHELSATRSVTTQDT